LKRNSGTLPDIRKKRGSGILLHITSLPSSYGIGDLGPQAYRFVDFLVKARQSYWQILPLTAADYKHGFSPYNCMSAFAGNKYLISPELLWKNGFLKRSELKCRRRFSERMVEFPTVAAFKDFLFDKAYNRFKKKGQQAGFREFCADNIPWLDDFALFTVLKENFQNSVWTEWPDTIVCRVPHVLRSLRKVLKPAIEREKFLQYIFARQWKALKRYCNKKHIAIIGDIPIYVDFNSADVWAHRGIFKLGKDGKPTHISGVPPDYFSSDGQLWGNPLYRWRKMAATGYRWWSKRIEHNLMLFDYVRMDHFRGFVAYWQVPAGAKTARSGKWVKAPALQFLSVLQKKFKKLPIIAEDLGTITPDVHALMRRFDLPGMRVLLFAFVDGNPANPYLPYNHVRHCIVYTGTHDNNTVRGWFEGEASRREKQLLQRYLGKRTTGRNIHEAVIRMAMRSVANTVIIPMQDMLGLSGRARMNRPASIGGNWRWRLMPGQLKQSAALRLRVMTETYGRE
jgi:4-alpha-glucanotransferase